MKKLIVLIAATMALFGCGSEGNGITAKCVDGTTSSSQSCSGTCSGHGGVAQWFGVLAGCGN